MATMFFIFTKVMGSLHLMAFVFSVLANFVASDYASSGTKLEVDQKSRLFRRLTVLQCGIAQLDNVMRLPLAVKLFMYEKGIFKVKKIGCPHCRIFTLGVSQCGNFMKSISGIVEAQKLPL